ncbi:hypothetical protein [Arenibacter palladensis]|uniref:hypothetical protein n=1 Tax=Arenibacter palladensis TaxID=237373 RepID=UPI0026E22A5C|nr:hypothetical protein [Arenibacter palladensis]MDO6605161.1 hypothetical protein [Arenibacter palladensis]
MHILFNRLFYIILFIGFFLPTNSEFYVPLPGVLLSINEFAFFLLPIINLLCYSENNVTIKNNRLKINIVLLILVVVFTEVVVKNLVYGQSPGEAFKTIRIGLPLFSSLLLIVQGIRADISIVWKTLLLAISASVIISFISLVVPLPIYHDVESGTDILEASRGRVKNSNFLFGLIGMYLLIQDNNHWYSRGRLVKITAILSVFVLILAFNRTLLAILFIQTIYLLWKKFDLIKLRKISFYGILVLLIFFGAYLNSQTMRDQIDKRIFSIVLGDESIAENTIEGNRDVIYSAVEKKLKSGYYVLGLPYKTPIFTWPPRWSTDVERDIRITDTSALTILLRYGFIPLILTLLIIRQLYRFSNNLFFKTILILYLMASLNIDVILRQNSILFLAFIFFITKAHIHEQNSIHSKDRY